MKKRLNILICSAIALFMLSCEKSKDSRINSAQQASVNQVIGQVEKGESSLLVSKEYINREIQNDLKPSGSQFTVKTAEVVSINEKHFLKIIGTNYENCRIPLELKDGYLYEGNHEKSSIVICHGDGQEGCEPKLKGNSWYCSDGPGECMKTSMISTDGIFENPFQP